MAPYGKHIYGDLRRLSSWPWSVTSESSFDNSSPSIPNETQGATGDIYSYLLYTGALCGRLRVTILGVLWASHWSGSAINLGSILGLYPLLGLPGAATAENGRTRPDIVWVAIGMLLPWAGTMWVCDSLAMYGDGNLELKVLMWSLSIAPHAFNGNWHKSIWNRFASFWHTQLLANGFASKFLPPYIKKYCIHYMGFGQKTYRSPSTCAGIQNVIAIFVGINW